MKSIGTSPCEKRLRKLMEDPRYWKHKDPEYVAMIQQGFQKLYEEPSAEARAAEGQIANEMGINGAHHAQDSMVAHVTPGEIVIPLSAQTPELMQYLSQVLGKDMLKYTVGSGQEQENPTSGLPAFAGCPKLHPMAFRMINETTAVHKKSRRVWLCKTNPATGEKRWEEQKNRVLN